MIVGAPKPLIILSADKNAQFAIQELIRRPAALGIRPVDFDCIAHPRHDSGVYKGAHEFLRVFLKWDYALVVFDREGCGYDERPRDQLESEVEGRLATNGWANRSKAIVLDPELESWVWDSSWQVSKRLDWPGGANALKRWMADREWIKAEQFKPDRPKEALDDALRFRRIKHSSALFANLAKDSRFSRCTDPAFQKFISTLQGWFPPSLTP